MSDTGTNLFTDRLTYQPAQDPQFGGHLYYKVPWALELRDPFQVTFDVHPDTHGKLPPTEEESIVRAISAMENFVLDPPNGLIEQMRDKVKTIVKEGVRGSLGVRTW